MGFIQAFTGALGGTFADEWKDFYKPQDGVPATAALFQAVPQGQNNNRGENTKGSENIISNIRGKNKQGRKKNHVKNISFLFIEVSILKWLLYSNNLWSSIE